MTDLRKAAERVDETAKREHEPYGYLWFTHQMERRFTHYRPKEEQRIGEVTPIYTAPPKREWVGLTDEEIEELAKWADKHAAPWHLEFAKAVEAKLKEKNTNYRISPANMRARCEALVLAMVGKELADKWWTGSNKAFNGETPEQMYSVSPDAVYAYLMRSAEGEW